MKTFRLLVSVLLVLVMGLALGMAGTSRTKVLTLRIEFSPDIWESAKKDIVEMTIRIIKSRLSRYGLAEFSVVPLSEGRIRVELPAADAGAEELVERIGLLEFKKVLKIGAQEEMSPSSSQEVLRDDEGVSYLTVKRPLMTGKSLSDARAQRKSDGSVSIALTFNDAGAEVFTGILKELELGDKIAVVLDDAVIDVLEVTRPLKDKAEAGWWEIKDSMAISCNCSLGKARILSTVLWSGAFPAKVAILGESFTGKGRTTINRVVDDFEDGNLWEWSHDILSTWATFSFDHGITYKDGSRVAFIQGGISNGGGGGQVLVREDLRGDDMRVRSKIKLNTGSGSKVNAGLTVRYQSTGKGYRATIRYNKRKREAVLTLHRMDGTEPGPNYKYRTVNIPLTESVNLPRFDPGRWHTVEMEAVGNRIRVKVDGQLYINTYDGTYSYGAPGLIFGGSNGRGRAYYDDFSVSIPGVSEEKPDIRSLNVPHNFQVIDSVYFGIRYTGNTYWAFKVHDNNIDVPKEGPAPEMSYYLLRFAPWLIVTSEGTIVKDESIYKPVALAASACNGTRPWRRASPEEIQHNIELYTEISNLTWYMDIINVAEGLVGESISAILTGGTSVAVKTVTREAVKETAEYLLREYAKELIKSQVSPAEAYKQMLHVELINATDKLEQAHQLGIGTVQFGDAVDYDEIMKLNQYVEEARIKGGYAISGLAAFYKDGVSDTLISFAKGLDPTNTVLIVDEAQELFNIMLQKPDSPLSEALSWMSTWKAIIDNQKAGLLDGVDSTQAAFIAVN